MLTRILFVDDDERILRTFQRSYSRDYDVHVCNSPEKALALVQNEEPFAVIVSDFKMPKMDGITFLHKVRQLSKDTVRVMLTGYADLDNAMAAVNSGEVFRFLTKPCDTEAMSTVLQSCVEQYELVTSERVLLEETLKGCIEMLSEVLSIVNPEAFGRASRISRFVHMIAKKATCDSIWKYEVAAMLSQVGCVILPEAAVYKLNKGKEFSPEEVQLFDMHPSIGRSLISHIPRMEEIADMVLYQHKGFDGSGSPHDQIQGEDIPYGARLIRLASDFELAYSKSKSWSKAFLQIEGNADYYDPELLYYLEGCLGAEARFDTGEVSVDGLYSGMIAQEAIRASHGALLVRKSKELSPTMIMKLKIIHERIGVREPISVLIPSYPKGDAAACTDKEQ